MVHFRSECFRRTAGIRPSRWASRAKKLELAFKFVVQPNNYEVKLATSAQRSRACARSGRAKAPGGVVLAWRAVRQAACDGGLLLQSYIQQVLLSDRSRVV